MPAEHVNLVVNIERSYQVDERMQVACDVGFQPPGILQIQAKTLRIWVFSLQPHLPLTKPHKKNFVLQKGGQEHTFCTIMPKLFSANEDGGHSAQNNMLIYI